MGKRTLGLLAVLALTVLPACGTVNGVRWAYNDTSCYGAPDDVSESVNLRAWVGVPVIVGGLAFDIATLPLQAIFGVWPLWGDESNMGKPEGV